MAFVVELKADVGVDADPEVIIHNNHGCLIFGVIHHLIGVSRGLDIGGGGRLRSLLLVKDDRPSIQSHFLGIDDVLQNVEW